MSLTRKLRKLRRNPREFFRDLLGKRSSPAARDTTDAIEAARASLRGHARPLVIAYHPLAADNPYQRLLYSAVAAEGAAAVPIRRLEDLLKARCDTDTVCHLHWLANVVGRATSNAEARRRIAQFTGQLDQLKARGVTIVWTVHNVLPHGATRRELECQLRRQVVARADAIHLMTERSFEETRPLYELPRDKTFVCPHPSYDGVYPDDVSRAAAREELGVPADATLFLAFGSIQPYKGLRELAGLFHRVGEACTLVIAGVPTDASLAATLERDFAANASVHLLLERVPDERVQHLFRAADYVVCAHRAVLNSGAAMLAHSFGVPVVGPSTGAIGELINAGGGLGFDLGDPDALVDAMQRAASGDPTRFAEAIAAERARTRPEAVSRAFLRALRDRIS